MCFPETFEGFDSVLIEVSTVHVYAKLPSTLKYQHALVHVHVAVTRANAEPALTVQYTGNICKIVLYILYQI